jgi:serine/threonine protein kinase
VKIVDFGLSALVNIAQGKSATEKAGTLVYMAPELSNKTAKTFNNKVDIWACGIIMYKLLTGGDHPLYQKGDTQEIYYDKL